MANLHPLLKPYVPSSDDPFDSIKAAHLLNRAGFGGTPEEIEKVMAMGPEQSVDWLMDYPDAGADEEGQNDQPDFSNIDGYPKDFRAIREMMAGKTQEERKALQQQLMQANREALMEVMKWWINRLAYGKYPLQEKLTLFWHGHFTTSAKDERSASLMFTQNELLRRMSAGNFHEFVRQISRDPAMLDYLNNTQNKKEHPNENYARELMELFTLGIGNYTENDIKNSAKAFTGWTHDGDDFVFRENEHDESPKTFMGRTGNFNGDDIIDMILQHPKCASYISSNLWQYFAYEEMEEGLAESMGLYLRENKWELRPLIRTMLLSKGFYQPRSIGSQIKSPVQLVVGTIRLLGLQTPNALQLSFALNQMGQVPLQPPNVRGWPGGRMWINTSTIFVRYNTCVYLAGGTMPGVLGPRGLIGKGQGSPRTGGNVTGRFNPGAQGGSGSDEIVDAWVNRLIQRPIDIDQKKILQDALGDVPDERALKNMVQLIMSMPEYQLC
jgi:Protein of unknown function (DUF1800)